MAATMIATQRPQWFDLATGVLDRRVFSDAEIYRLELERIFGRAGTSCATSRSCPNAGDYLHQLHRRGPGDRRARARRARSTCCSTPAATAATRCAAPSRAARKSFVCSYHGWNYDLDGRLIGDARPGDLLSRRPRQEPTGASARRRRSASYRGFVLRDARSDRAAAARTISARSAALGIGMLCAHGDLEVRRRHPEEHHRLQLEDRRRQPLRLVSREDTATPRRARRLHRPRGDRAPEEPDGDARRLRARRSAGRASPKRSCRTRSTRMSRRRSALAMPQRVRPARSAGGSTRAARRAAGSGRRAQHRPSEHLPEPVDHAGRHAGVPAHSARAVRNRALVVHHRAEGRCRRRTAARNRSAWPTTCSARPACWNRTTAKTGATRRAAQWASSAARLPLNYAMGCGHDRVSHDAVRPELHRNRASTSTASVGLPVVAEWMRGATTGRS